MNKQPVYVRILAAFGAFALCLSLLLTSLFSVSYDMRFYEKEYEKLGQAQVIGIPDETLSGITRRVIAYLKGNLPNLDMQIKINDQWREVFNDREKAHMVDVLSLFELGRCAQGIGFLLFAALSALSLLLFKGTGAAFFKKRLSALGLSGLFGCGAFLVLLGGLALLVSFNFDAAFIRFHQIFFTNDLWLLDPETDILIQMVPEAFFVDCVGRIALVAVAFLGAILLFFAGLYLLGFVFGRESRKERESVENIFEALGVKDEQVKKDKDEPEKMKSAAFKDNRSLLQKEETEEALPVKTEHLLKEMQREETKETPKKASGKETEQAACVQPIELPIRMKNISDGQGVVLQLKMELMMVRENDQPRLELIPGTVPKVEITPRGEKQQARLSSPDSYQEVKNRIRNLMSREEVSSVEEYQKAEEAVFPDMENEQEETRAFMGKGRTPEEE